ncbi:copper homeostasis protein CutC [Microbacterium sp. ASV49]|uniref:PF03932 family protein CutC n=1 Tax=Microbacterium candidum TaxID=3041922 RepID=A0ABT7N084_9MICO|nr:copper homeostasis protein CutC [Microbacterium sp. ASV49]MDL9980120.1 copper homeostasis protein CutC [Microbacterium sp. ASV49]
MTARPVAVEIAVQSAEGVRIAVDADATRIELTQGLRLGGLTPSAGLIADAVEISSGLDGFVNVLIRPRGGGFVFAPDEVQTMVRDIRAAVMMGASGVVVGALTDDGTLDVDTLRRFIDVAEDLDVTVHRAVDASVDPVASVAALAGLGVCRVLTSGGAARSGEGVDTLAQMVREASGRLEIMAGGGVAIDVIPALVAAGVDAVHLSASRPAERGASGPGGGVDAFEVTDPDLVAAAVAATAAASR